MQKAPEFQRVKYVSDRVPELQGQWVEVPGDLPLDRAAKWIEQDYAARAEEERIDAEAQLQIEETPAEPEIDRVDLLREELAGIHNRLDTGDAAQYSQAIRDNASAMQHTWELSQKLESLQKRAREAVEADEHALDSAETFYREASQQQERTMKMLQANQKIVNGSISSTSRGIAELRQQLADAHKEVGELKAAASANRALIAKAGKIVKAWESREGSK